MPHDQWQSTSLWQELLSRENTEASAVRSALQSWMPDVERILAYGGTSPKDFTLHDAEHSYRVAEWMVRLLPEDMLPKLSEFELALLLLSAYLHDIGMTPEVDKVRRHREFLMSGKAGLLSESENKLFQRWLDDAGYNIVPPVSTNRPLDQVIRLADEIITYYTRHRHNDWSEEWIRKRLRDGKLGSYTGWVNDLARLCRSHHDGYNELVGKEFNPRRVGSPAQVVHLRYLATLLRMADILDVDRERTPEVIFHHREISDRSQTYWNKDADLTLELVNRRLSASARPPRAYLHRAIEETLDLIERELILCSRLDDETHFGMISGPAQVLPHRWDLHPTIFRDITPRDHAYEYIDGTFRPDMYRLLELLSGTELYGNPLAAVRELLQNSFDAVRELIAYQRLQQPYPAVPELGEQIGALLEVRISLEQHVDGVWLVCRDDGIGMSKNIIENYFLIGGAPTRSQIIELERRCNEVGFSLGRTGQFGIGALSYFMIADRLVLVTRRSTDSGDFEPTGWRFESSGLEGFGELRRDTSLARGTEVKLRLRRNLIEKEDFRVSLARYIRSAVVHTPCRFTIHNIPKNDSNGTFKPGWVLPRRQHAQLVFPQNAGSSKRGRRKRRRSGRQLNSPRRRARHALHVVTEAGELPDGLGRYRLHLPFFELSGGRSLIFLDGTHRHGAFHVSGTADGPTGQVAQPFTSWAWKGMRISPDGLSSQDPLGDNRHDRWYGLGVSAEISFDSPAAGTLSISRGALRLSEAALGAAEWLGDRAESFVDKFVSEHRQSNYALLNARWTNTPVTSDVTPIWAIDPALRSHSDPELFYWAWQSLTFPRIAPHSPPRLPPYPPVVQFNTLLSWCDKTVRGEVPINMRSNRYGERRLSWNDDNTPPQRILPWVRNGIIVPVPVWTRWEIRPPFVLGGTLCDFPPAWKHVCGIHTFGWTAWNQAHPFVKRVAQLLEAFSAGQEQDAHTQFDRKVETAFLGHFIKSRRFTPTLEDRPRVRQIWDALFTSQSEPEDLVFYDLVHGEPLKVQINLLSKAGWKHLIIPSPEGDEALAKYVPIPGETEWLLKSQLPAHRTV